MISGIYILQIILETNKNIGFGKDHNHFFQEGTYFYVGSALNGLDARIQRHLSPDKKMHWHIDYLLEYARITQISYKITSKKEECLLAQQLTQEFCVIPNFGASDCRCGSHLFYIEDQEISSFNNHLKMRRYPISTKN